MGNCNAYSSPGKSNQEELTKRSPERKPTHPSGLAIALKPKEKSIVLTPLNNKLNSPSRHISSFDLTNKSTDNCHIASSLSTANTLKYTREEREFQTEVIKTSDSPQILADNLHYLNIELEQKFKKQNINIPCFVKCFKIESKSEQSEEKLIEYFENIKDNLVSGFWDSIKNEKAKNLDDFTEFEKYKSNFTNDKAKVREIVKIISEYKDQMLFQMLLNHTSIFSEMERKLSSNKRVEYFNEIRLSMYKLHCHYFDIVEILDPAKLEKVYHAYLNEEYNLFNLFHRYETTVSQVFYTEFKP